MRPSGRRETATSPALGAGDTAFDSRRPDYSNATRSRKMVTITLSPEALTRLDAIAEERGQSRSGAVEQLVRNARLASR